MPDPIPDPLANTRPDPLADLLPDAIHKPPLDPPSPDSQSILPDRSHANADEIAKASLVGNGQSAASFTGLESSTPLEPIAAIVVDSSVVTASVVDRSDLAPSNFAPSNFGPTSLAGDQPHSVIVAWPVERPLPRLWTVLVAVVATLVLSIVGSAAIYFAVFQIKYGPVSPQQISSMRQEFEDFARTRMGFLTMVLPGQLIFLVMALVAAKLSPQPFRERLTLTRGRLAIWQWWVLATATPAVGFLTSILLAQITRDRGANMETMQKLFLSHEGPFLVVMVALVGIMPGICEELFFRGYVQTRLLARFPPLVAIGTTSLLFSIAHLDPIHAVAVFPLGVWLGVITWRSQSIWPAVLGHTINNSAAVLLTQLVGDPKSATPSAAAAVTLLLIFAVTGASLLLALLLLVTRPRVVADGMHP